ncbi:MAG: hypothetical protein C5B54_02560 [Acidobacteria bacterium]|nr:MAG: hypothetical protein C5B54_02560 [Acidobacteriota bacterium]
MNKKIFAAMTAFALCFCFQIGFAQDKDKAMQDEMMKKWMAYATPGDVHKQMATMVGSWDTVVKDYTQNPAGTETKASSTFTSVMDGRFVHEDAEGNFNGMPFHGMGLYGYDNATKKYVATWVDNMGTGQAWSSGTSEDGGKTIKYTGTMTDPMSGKSMTYHSVMHMVSNDEYHMEMMGPGKDGKDMKMMEITYTRKK